jgi:c-di-GMP-binding flagellar brake protein YcgR
MAGPVIETSEGADRRRARRYDLSLPIVVQISTKSDPLQRNGQTRDISTRGVYFTMEEELAPGSEFDITLTLPSEVTKGSDVFIRARGRVVRIDRRPGANSERIGVAAVMENYDIVRADSKGF